MGKPTYKSTILVTGGTTGLGYGAALALARQRPDSQIIIASRSNSEDSATKINTALHQSNTIYLPLDLSSADSITAFASNITKTYPIVSHLLLNAGLQFPAALSTIQYFSGDDIEKTFAINHLGHAHLLYLLLPHLTKDAHIVVVASGVHDPAQKAPIPDPHYTTADEVAHPDPKTANANGQERYATSKLCNVLWTYALDRRIKSTGKQMVANSFDPGLMFGTGLARGFPWIARFVWNHILPRLIPLMRLLMGMQNIHTPMASGESLARLALGEDDGVKGVSGKYFEGRKAIPSSVASYEEEKQEELWDWTLEYLAKGDKATKAKWAKLEG